MVLLDGEGSELGARPAVNLVAAKQEMTYLLSEAFAAEVGSTQRALGSAKVEVRDAQGLCVLDMDLSRSSLVEKMPRNESAAN